MAALKELESKPERLVLGRGGQQALGTLVSLIIFGALVVVGLSSMFEGEGPGDLVGLITSVIFGLIILGSVVSAARSTRVIVDAAQRIITRNDLLLVLPLNRQELHFNGIRNVRVGWTGLPTLREEGLPFWQVTVEPSSGAPLVLNQQGTHAEMASLADKVGQFVNRPVTDDLTESSPRPQAQTDDQSLFTPSGAMASLVGNLIDFAQSTQTGYSPPIVAPSRGLPSFTNARETRERGTGARRRMPPRAANPPPTLPGTQTRAPSSEPDLSAPVFMPTVQSFTEPETQAYASGALMYSAPPLMVMPELPLLFTFPAALEVPSLPPILSDTLQAQVSEIPEMEEFKQVDAIASGGLVPTSTELQRIADAEPTNARAQYQLARSQHAMRSLNIARMAYERALRVDPVNGAVHNDLGVLYYQQGNLTASEQSFRRAVALDPFSAASRYNLGLVLARTRRARDAHEQFVIGQQNASRADASSFEEALRGSLNDPILSPQP